MANKDVNKALDVVDLTYDELIVIANDIYKGAVGEIDTIVESVADRVEILTNEEIRQLITKLSIKAFSFCEIKDKSAFKATLAESLKDEKYATLFNAMEGTVAVRENSALLGSAEELLAGEIYKLIAQLFKTKLDTVYRLIDTLKTVLTTRLTEAKLSGATTSTSDF